MYVKPIKYGHTPANTHGQAVGGVAIEILPQGELTQQVQLTIEEAHDMGKWPEPMVRISINNQKEVLLSLVTLLSHSGLLDTPDQSNIAIGQNMTEPEDIFIEPENMVKDEWYIGNSNSDRTWLAKFDRFDYNKYWLSKSILLEKGTPNSIGFLLNFFDIRKATREEVLKYFPEEQL